MMAPCHRWWGEELTKRKSADEKPQRDRFVEKARDLNCDEDEDRFNETLKRIVKGSGSVKQPREGT